jgi:diguanylate cyclase (GGDEF)-like protein
VLAEEMRLTLAAGRPVSLLMLDIDRFKQVNDSHGHPAGDRVLSAVARALNENARASDVACRYGGDEFLVLMHGLSTDEARTAAERLRGIIDAIEVDYAGSIIGVTISIGAASAQPEAETSLDDLVARADRALYAAKQSGKDRVCVEERASAE